MLSDIQIAQAAKLHDTGDWSLLGLDEDDSVFGKHKAKIGAHVQRVKERPMANYHTTHYRHSCR